MKFIKLGIFLLGICYLSSVFAVKHHQNNPAHLITPKIKTATVESSPTDPTIKKKPVYDEIPTYISNQVKSKAESANQPNVVAEKPEIQQAIQPNFKETSEKKNVLQTNFLEKHEKIKSFLEFLVKKDHISDYENGIFSKVRHYLEMMESKDSEFMKNAEIQKDVQLIKGLSSTIDEKLKSQSQNESQDHKSEYTISSNVQKAKEGEGEGKENNQKIGLKKTKGQNKNEKNVVEKQRQDSKKIKEEGTKNKFENDDEN